MNTIEFSLREFNTGGFPKGLSLMLGIMPRWLYERDGSPTDALRFEAPLAELKSRLAKGERVFEELLQRLIVDNQHVATVELAPDPELGAAQKQEEADLLAKVKSGMSEEELKGTPRRGFNPGLASFLACHAEAPTLDEHPSSPVSLIFLACLAHPVCSSPLVWPGVIASTKALKEAQLKEDTPEQLASIPRVGIKDLEREVKVTPTEVAELPGGGKMLTHPLPTSGVVYADLLLDMSVVPLEDLPLMRFFSSIIDEVGTSDMNAVQMQRKIGARTGGISTAMMYEQPTGPDGTVGSPSEVAAYFVVRGKATSEKAGDMLELAHALLADANLKDAQSKAVELLRETQTSLETSFISSGNSYAGMRLASRNTLVGYIGETTQGVSYYESVKSMLALAKDDWPAMLKRLETLRDSLLSQAGLVVNLTADPDVLKEVQPAVDAFVAKLPPTAAVAPGKSWAEAVQMPERENEGYAITTQVNYVAAGAKLFEPGEEVGGALYAVARYLSRGYLWDNVRVVGGAYGGGCSLNPNTGVLSFSSYRDPNLQGTVDIYAGTAKVLDELELSDEALEQAIVGAVGDLDSPMTSQSKGFRGLQHHITGVTTEIRQHFRDEVIATDRASFAAVAERLRGKALKVSVFGEQEALEKANAARGADEQIEVKPLK